jgi:formate dehydrogenase maturation protein FdhE
MGNWDACARQQLQALIEALVCPKCGEANAPGHANIEYDPHLRAAHCTVCAAAWCVKPAAA